MILEAEPCTEAIVTSFTMIGDSNNGRLCSEHGKHSQISNYGISLINGPRSNRVDC